MALKGFCDFIKNLLTKEVDTYVSQWKAGNNTDKAAVNAGITQGLELVSNNIHRMADEFQKANGETDIHSGDADA